MGFDWESPKEFKKFLTKQGLKFKLHIKVSGAQKTDNGVLHQFEA